MFVSVAEKCSVENWEKFVWVWHCSLSSQCQGTQKVFHSFNVILAVC